MVPGSHPTLYLNENIEVPLVQELTASGISTIHTYAVGNGGISDNDQLEYAARNNYILVTHNRKDFLKLHAAWIAAGKTHSGIILIKFFSQVTDLRDKLIEFLEKRYPKITPPFCESASEL